MTSDLCFKAPPPSATTSFSPQSLFMQMICLQKDSGFHYANSIPIKTLSKQIFREQQKEEVVTGPRRVNSVWGWTSSVNVCIVLCGQGDLCKHTALPPESSRRWSAAPGLACLRAFQFKALICMCEMCCSGVKCSAVPSSSEIAPAGWTGEERLEEAELRRRRRKKVTGSLHVIFHLAEQDVCMLVWHRLQVNQLPFFSLTAPRFRLLSPSCLPVTAWWRESPLWPLRSLVCDEAVNYQASMRIFSLLLNNQSPNYIHHPTFCLIIHQLVIRFGGTTMHGYFESKNSCCICWMLSLHLNVWVHGQKKKQPTLFFKRRLIRT